MSETTKKRTVKYTVAIICAVLVIAVAVGATIAYIMADTPPVENTFEPVFVSCAVEETFDGAVKSNVTVKNTGDISAYIRAAVVVTWVSDNDGSVNSTAPVAEVDYSISMGSSLWVKGSDGFYYYTAPIVAGESTEKLINTLTTVGDGLEGHSLSVQILASAIQAEPVEAVNMAWGASVSADGSLISP